MGLRLRSANALLRAEIEELAKQFEQAVQQLAQYEVESKSKTFTTMVDLLAAAGIPDLVLLAAMAISGFTGSAAITLALSSLGGPAGMPGGIGVLVTLGVVIATYGVTDVSLAVVFSSHIRNPNTRRAYREAVRQFSAFCAEVGIQDLARSRQSTLPLSSNGS